jgi:putrescine transport system permease protein
MRGPDSPGRRLRRPGRGLVLALPYGWLLLFFLVPLAIVLKIAFAEPALSQPPYTPLLEWLQGAGFEELRLRLTLNLANFLRLLDDPLYRLAVTGSLRIAAVSTLLCLALGYPMAYAMARAPEVWRTPLLMLVILPFWTSFLIRVYAWMGILRPNGLLNGLLLWAGLIEQPLVLLYTPFAVALGITYSYLPFMVLPLYATLVKFDWILLDAAADLGCRPWRAFLAVTLPLSLPGVMAGALLVFIPAVGEFVIPELLGGPGTLMIGKVLWSEFFTNRDWPAAAALTMALLVLLVGPMMLLQALQARGERR